MPSLSRIAVACC
ncbi:unnamed protein product [Cuscuta europaea]|uniref:Uncharacterized protein n=1 Tax=Cuscuta europaea TaxID=41803 RepID=A0A9P0YQ33_CUSEU|nr:unnamed protein product [Cuscuta europaea]